MPYNERFPEQWKAIQGAIDLSNKSVLDLGCGYGDMVMAVHEIGGWVTGVDNNSDMVNIARNRLVGRGIPEQFIVEADITNLGPAWDKADWDVIVCFSVLPYIEDYSSLLLWIARHSKKALLEIQAKGDGPGISRGDGETRDVLSAYFNNVRPIGRTLVTYRNIYRTIWLCDNVV